MEQMHLDINGRRKKNAISRVSYLKGDSQCLTPWNFPQSPVLSFPIRSAKALCPVLTRYFHSEGREEININDICFR